MLELAILGLLSDASMHGYELRKRLTEMLGSLRTFSYGSLYPTLRKLADAGYIAEDEGAGTFGTSRRGKRVYRLTPSGSARLSELLDETGPEHHTDEGFGVHLAFFGHTTPETRVRILEGRRRLVEERREMLRSRIEAPATERYSRELNQLALENADRELRWLNTLIASEVEGERNDAGRDGAGRVTTQEGDPDRG